MNKEDIEGEEKDRLLDAISKWDNNKIERVPILIYAWLFKKENTNEYCVAILFSDEDADVAGIGIREEKLSDGSQAIEERYPIFIKGSPRPVDRVFLPIHFRINNQQKDELEWDKFICDPFNIKMPPIWISIPDERDIKVEIFIYDNNNNISKTINVKSILK